MLRLLGPVEVPGVPGVAVDSPRQRLVLAALAVEAGRPVPVSVLLDRVWGADPPPHGRRTLHAYVARARRTLAGMPGGPVGIEGRNGTYLLRLDPQRVDLHHFRRLVGQAQAAGCPPDRRVGLLREAIGLWRGWALAGLGGAWSERMRDSWQQERLSAMAAWADAELTAGDPAVVLGPVGEMVADHPLDEVLAAVWMRVLSALGRSAEALSRYEQIRARLHDEFDVEPGPRLRSAQRAVLRGEIRVPDPVVPAASGPLTRPTGAVPAAVPAQLPAGLAVFAGRVGEIAELDDLAAAAATSTAPVVVVLSGTAGVGKSTLAVHWAHRVVAEFPDGQLYVNLRSFDPASAAMSPADVIRGFLGAFQISANRIPADFDAQVYLYRSLLSGRRVLLLLDNARDADQVRPLLPVAPGCLTLVTSRSPQTPLVVTEGARPVALDLMSVPEARDLLARRLGAWRTGGEPEAVDEIIARCCRLPLAISIVAARARSHAGAPLAATVSELRDAASALDALDGGDPITDVRSVFSWSYRSLGADAARLFRWLGLHPGPDAGRPAAAVLAGAAPARTRTLLAELIQAGLVHEHLPGRYTFHDLLRAYAVERANLQDSEDTRRAALQRVVEYYLEATRANAVQALMCWPLTADDPVGGGAAPSAADRARAVAWLGTEREVLLAVVDRAAGAGLHIQGWQLAWALMFFLLRQGRWHELLSMHRTALAACEQANDLTGQSHMVHGLALGHARSGRFDEASPHFTRAWALAEQTGDRILQGRICSSRAWQAERRGDTAGALRHAQHGQALYRAAGFRWGEAEALGDVGYCHALRGDHEQAIDCCERALAMLRGLNHVESEAAVAGSLGYIHLQLGDFTKAVAWCQRSIDMYHRFGDRYNEGLGHATLGDIHKAAGDDAAARAAWQRALVMLDDIQHPDAVEIRAKLAG